MVNKTMVNKLQKILKKILERNGATNCCVKCNGETIKISYSFQISSSDNVNNSFERPCENTVQENLRYIACDFWADYLEFDEDKFVRERMDMDGAPTIRKLLSNSEKLRDFYESTTRLIYSFCFSPKSYRDTESGEIFTRLELLEQYIENENDIYESCGAENFWQYLNCCLTGNGTLEEM